MHNTVYLVLFKSFQIECILKLLFLEQQLKRQQQQQRKHPPVSLYS